jgi:YggT family protein
MYLLANLLIAVASILNIILTLYMWVVIIAALTSWVNPDPYNPIVRFLRNVTEPVFQRIRKVIGSRLGIIDISPMLVILGILFVKYFFIQSLLEFAYRLKGGL